jgi:hypothetical protein
MLGKQGRTRIQQLRHTLHAAGALGRFGRQSFD